MTHAVALSRETNGKVAASSLPRSRVYAILSQSLSFPEVRFHSDIRRGFWMESLAASSERLPYPLRLPAARSFTVPGDFDAFQSEYIRLFEVGGRGGAPCPLYSGHYSNDRLRALESLVRFYNFFGVQTEQGMMPDHVAVELEFMSHLTETEAAARNESDRRSCRRAQADFLDNHLANWWPKIAEKIKRHEPLPFYRSLAGFTSKFLDAELTHLAARPDPSSS